MLCIKSCAEEIILKRYERAILVKNLKSKVKNYNKIINRPFGFDVMSWFELFAWQGLS